MGFFDSLTGSSQRKDMRNGMEAFSRSVRGAQKYTRDYSGRAQNHLRPFAQQGQQANSLYSDAIGVNGRDAQQGYWDEYASDPQREYDENRAVDAVNRGSAARGLSNSGWNALAGARAGMDMGRSYTMDRLDRLRGHGAQGLGVANQMANIDLGTGNALAGYEMMDGQSRQGMHQGLASTRNAGFNNALKVGGMLISAATGMPVGMGGSSSGSTTMAGGHNVGMHPSGYGGDDTGPGGGRSGNFLNFNWR